MGKRDLSISSPLCQGLNCPGFRSAEGVKRNLALSAPLCQGLNCPGFKSAEGVKRNLALSAPLCQGLNCSGFKSSSAKSKMVNRFLLALQLFALAMVPCSGVSISVHEKGRNSTFYLFDVDLDVDTI